MGLRGAHRTGRLSSGNIPERWPASWFLYGLLSRFAFVDTALRSMAAIGGALFIAFVTTGFTLWNAPLLDDNLDEFGAETYLALDDAGWILLGAAASPSA